MSMAAHLKNMSSVYSDVNLVFMLMCRDVTLVYELFPSFSAVTDPFVYRWYIIHIENVYSNFTDMLRLETISSFWFLIFQSTNKSFRTRLTCFYLVD